MNKMTKGSEMRYEAVFFDFDGVILDSVDVKTKAFAQMYAKYGKDIENEVVKYHLANGGMSRVKKMEYYCEQLLNKKATKEEIDCLCKEFADLVVEKVLSSQYMPNAYETLEELKHQKIPAFVVSGTPDEEIKFIVEKKGLSPYFIEVHGSPRQKDEIVNHIQREYRYDLSECLFVGDALSDYNAAKKVGTQFLGIIQSTIVNPFPDDVVISDKVIIGYE